MAANAFECQIEPVGNAPIEPPGHVDGLFSIDLVTGEDNHGADRVGDRPKGLVLLLGKLW